MSDTNIDCSLRRVFKSLGSQRVYNDLDCVLVINIIMLKWDIFNASLLLHEHGHPSLLFYNQSSHMISIQWAKFKQKSMFSFISGLGNYLKEISSEKLNKKQF